MNCLKRFTVNVIFVEYVLSNMTDGLSLGGMRRLPIVGGLVTILVTLHALNTGSSSLFILFLLICGVGIIIEEVIRSNADFLRARLS